MRAVRTLQHLQQLFNLQQLLNLHQLFNLHQLLNLHQSIKSQLNQIPLITNKALPHLHRTQPPTPLVLVMMVKHTCLLMVSHFGY